MKNLENLNLQELTTQEQINTDGGFFPGATTIISIASVIVTGVSAAASVANVVASFAGIATSLFTTAANIGSNAYLAGRRP